jgi:hypothetical protein
MATAGLLKSRQLTDSAKKSDLHPFSAKAVSSPEH